MPPENDDFSIHEHDWHSQEYVDTWIAKDVQGDGPRRELFDQMMGVVGLPGDTAIRTLDVGCGYGFVTEAVLRAYPAARATLIDYSEPMLGHARQRLAAHGDQIDYRIRDLTDPKWNEGLGGPFDVIVSASVLHNLLSPQAIGDSYKAIAEIAEPDAVFLNCDLFDVAGGIELHTDLLKQAGFRRVRTIWHETPFAILAADFEAAD